VIDALLAVIGAIYLPFLAANAAALQSGSDTVRLEAMGHAYTQAPFKYQAKCLAALRQAFADLPEAARTALSPRLAATGCLDLLTT
jgi:hypothetical protein